MEEGGDEDDGECGVRRRREQGALQKLGLEKDECLPEHGCRFSQQWHGIVV